MKNSKSITMKICFKCDIEKPLTEYYKHKSMHDGHLNKCKSCTKSDVIKRESELRKDFNWNEKEKERQREKYKRLNYKDKHKPNKEHKAKASSNYKERFPEKIEAKSASQRIKVKRKGNQKHHWSYNKEHYKDIIELTPELHYLIHRLMDYDSKTKLYKSKEDNEILDTKEKHIAFIRLCNFRRHNNIPNYRL